MGDWVIGIDPGNKGALVAIGPDDELIVVPGQRPAGLGWTSDSGRLAALQRVLYAKGPDDRIGLVLLEQQQARARQQGQAKINREQGLWEGWMQAFGIPHQLVLPRGRNGWRAILGKPHFRKGEDPKVWTEQYISKRMPQLDPYFDGKLSVFHDGVTDAAGMAWAARKLLAKGA